MITWKRRLIWSATWCAARQPQLRGGRPVGLEQRAYGADGVDGSGHERVTVAAGVEHSLASVLRPAVDRGTKLAIMTTPPAGSR